jgi:hypothetical protein
MARQSMRHRISESTHREVVAFANEAVARSFGEDIELHTPDFGRACQNAQSARDQAKKNWEEGGRPRTGDLWEDYLAAIATASIMCALAGRRL